MPRFPDEDLLRALAAGLPLIDVRAPVEFARGSIPGATNLPLLDDEQRAQIGTVYKQEGSEAAVALGHRLISSDVREVRIAAWKSFAAAHPQAWIYCFRGGLRSQSVRQTLKEQGFDLPLIEGGYKRVRQLLLTTTDAVATNQCFRVVSGYTGTRKTELLHSIRKLRPVCDLESLANHKGSAFGIHQKRPQPAQADFENRLAIEFMRTQDQGPIAIEDESRMIGYNVLPQKLFDKMQTEPVYLVEASRADRAAYLVKSYLLENLGYGKNEDPERLRQPIFEGLSLIRRRLGGLEFSNLVLLFEAAVTEHRRTNLIESHHAWVERLLKVYYDPFYQFHLSKIEPRIQVRGSFTEVREALLSGKAD